MVSGERHHGGTISLGDRAGCVAGGKAGARCKPDRITAHTQCQACVGASQGCVKVTMRYENGTLLKAHGRAAVVVTDDFPCFFLPRMLAAAAPQVPVRFELVDSIDSQHTRREPKVEQEKAGELAREAIAKEYRSFTEEVKDFGHAEIIERKKPQKDPMVVEPKGLVYLPVWCVEGKGGAMIVNSSSGKIISEHLHGPEARRG